MMAAGGRYCELTYREFAAPLHNALRLGPVRDRAYLDRIFGRLKEFLYIGGIDEQSSPRQDRLWCLASLTGLSERVACDRSLQRHVTDFLLSIGWQPDELDGVFTALERHLTEPAEYEECLIHDAQAMESLGALGVAKAFTLGAAWGQSYGLTIQMVRDHVAGLRLYTSVGRQMAEARKSATEDFLVRLECETQGEFEVHG